MREVEPPGEQPRERVLGGLRRGAGAVRSRAGRRRPSRVLKPCAWAPTTLRSTPPYATLVDRPEAVDEKVVADVVPAVALHVVELDRLARSPPPARGCSRSARRCGARPRSAAPRVRRRRRDGSTRSRPTRTSARSAARRRRASADGTRELGAPAPARRERRHAADRAGTRGGRRGRPTTGSRSATPRADATSLEPGSGRSSASGRGRRQALQRPLQRACPELDAAGPAPVDPDEREAPAAGGAAPRRTRAVDRGDRRAAGPGAGVGAARRGERGEQGEESRRPGADADSRAARVGHPATECFAQGRSLWHPYTGAEPLSARVSRRGRRARAPRGRSRSATAAEARRASSPSSSTTTSTRSLRSTSRTPSTGPRTRARRGRARPRHARRARFVDARDREALPRVGGAGDRLRRAAGVERGLRGRR